MDHNQFLSKLEEAEALLKEALALLFYEPAKTPEGMLAIEAKEALKCLRETIMDVKDQVVTSHMRSIQWSAHNCDVINARNITKD